MTNLRRPEVHNATFGLFVGFRLTGSKPVVTGTTGREVALDSGHPPGRD